MTSSDDQARFIGELIASSGVLDQLEQAAPAEAWASSAIAEWAALGGDPAELRVLVGEAGELVGQLFDWLNGAEPPTGGADWATDVGTHEPVRAAVVFSDEDSAIVIEFAAESGAEHSASISISDGVAVDLTLGPAGLIDATESTGLFMTEELAVPDAVEMVSRSLAIASVATLTEDAILNLAALLRRFDVDVDLATVLARTEVFDKEVGDQASREGGSDEDWAERTVSAPARDLDDDRYAARVLKSALGFDQNEAAPSVVEVAAIEFARKLASGDADALALAEIAGFTSDPGEGQVEILLQCVGAYLAPTSLAVHDDVETRQAIAELEWADWLGAVIGLAREPAGFVVDGESLVDLINRCPEVTTSIPAKDRPRIAWTFEQVLYAWEVTGVIDDDSKLTAAGIWVLPRAAESVWGTG